MADDLKSRIEATERKYRLLFDNPHDSIWVIDVATMKVIYASSVNEMIDGRAPGETIGQTLDKLVTPEFEETVKERLKTEVARFRAGERGGGQMEAEILTKDGSVVKAEVGFRIFEDENELKLFGITRNPFAKSELLEVETELETQFKELLAERDRLRWEVKILEGLLPICANCKKIRDENGGWHYLEEYVESHSEAQFTHSICPPCMKKLYPSLVDKK